MSVPMLDEQELNQIRDYIIRVLPELLRKEPEIAVTIEGMLAQHFPRRDEFARMLDELRLLRERMDQQFALLREEMNQRFGQVDRRFEQAEQRFEQMERRFEQVDRRFEQVEQRLDLQREELVLLREEMNQRFALQHQEILEIRRDIARLQHGQDMILKRMEGQEAWLRLVVGELRAEKGQALEDLFAEGLRYGLKNPDLRPESLRLRQVLRDPEGQVFKPGFATEVDLIAEDNTLTVFEIKAAAEVDDVDLLAMKVQLMALQNPDKVVQGIFITLVPSENVRQRCAELGLRLAD
ncbi:MAG: hypothetical protein N0A15_10225 [Anaerolineae bacterium]|nr:hypothetical protein [Anaerolineae bacterium]